MNIHCGVILDQLIPHCVEKFDMLKSSIWCRKTQSVPEAGESTTVWIEARTLHQAD
jgi:hypothetical protein